MANCTEYRQSVKEYAVKKGGNQMAIVKEIRDGPCTIYIHDDAVVQTPEEKQKIIDNVSRIVIRALSAKEEPA